jgi:hypothetical protein
MLLVSLLALACSKKDSGPSRSELLTNGSWKLTSSEWDNDANGTYELDIFPGFDDCFKDNFATFLANGQLILDEGPTKCDIADPQTETSSWQLSSDGKMLTVDSDTYEILELNSSILKFKQALSGGRSNRVTFTKR